MAIFYPSINKINKFRVPPTDGEWTLINFLKDILDDTFEVYFNPFLNGDRPDIIIMKKGQGVLIIEVKDWNLENFDIDDRRKWRYKQNGSVVKSPIDQVLKYKNNLFDLHVEELLLHKIKDFKHFNVVSCCIYFHNHTYGYIYNKLINPFLSDKKYQDFLKYQIDFLGCDSLNPDFLQSLFKRRYLISQKPSSYFTDDIYNNFRRILSPAIHLKSQGVPYQYSSKQKSIIYSDTLEQRIRGVFGSGKTTVLAARAVQAYKRALSRTDNPRILILTFNITLKNFIHDKLQRIDESFQLENFIIINYHQFINAELNNLNIEFEIPEGLSQEEISKYLESRYYGNLQLFEDREKDIVKYDAVLIDEIQDYHRSWMDIIKKCFRDPKGDYVLFGDVKQNIYGQPTANKDVVTNVHGVNELKYCFRSDFKVRDLAKSFQSNIFASKYDIDDFSENDDLFLGQKIEKEGYINYMFLSDANPIVSLYNIIRGNILNKASNISPNDITILGYRSSLLRYFDAFYRYSCGEKTNSMVETIETMYMVHLNKLAKDVVDKDHWYLELFELIQKYIYPRTSKMYEYQYSKIKTVISSLFTLYDLYCNYPSHFQEKLERLCHKYGLSLNWLKKYMESYNDSISSFKITVFADNYKKIRDNKKLHFWMNSGTVKISTINSFKGWESEVLFLILEDKFTNENEFNANFDELLYTGITRCKNQLVIINFGNADYDAKIRPLIESLK